LFLLFREVGPHLTTVAVSAKGQPTISLAHQRKPAKATSNRASVSGWGKGRVTLSSWPINENDCLLILTASRNETMVSPIGSCSSSSPLTALYGSSSQAATALDAANAARSQAIQDVLSISSQGQAASVKLDADGDGDGH
jgi:hypothetical protein